MNDGGVYNNLVQAPAWARALHVALFLIAPVEAGLLFSEVMISASRGGEWIELFNPDSSAVPLSGVRLYEGNDTVALDPSKKFSVPARGYLLVAQDSARVRSAYPYIGCRMLDPSSWLTLNNDADTLGLCDSTGVELDRVGFEAGAWLGSSVPDGISLERRNPSVSSDLASNWALCRNPNGATPGFANSVLPAATTEFRLLAGPKLFRPESGERIRINVDLPGNGNLVLAAFSFEGRSEHTIFSGPATDRFEISWDGRHQGRALKPGPYVLLAEWTVGKRKDSRKQAIVIGPAK